MRAEEEPKPGGATSPVGVSASISSSWPGGRPGWVSRVPAAQPGEARACELVGREDGANRVQVRLGASLCHVAVDLPSRAHLGRTMGQAQGESSETRRRGGARRPGWQKVLNERRLRAASRRRAPRASSVATPPQCPGKSRSTSQPGLAGKKRRVGRRGAGELAAHPTIPEVRLLVLQQRGGAVGRPQLPRHSQERRLLTILARHGAEGLAGRPAPTSFTRLAARAKPTVGPRLPFESRACARAHAHENTSNAEGGRRADRRAGRFWRPRAPSSAGLKSSWVRLIYTALL